MRQHVCSAIIAALAFSAPAMAQDADLSFMFNGQRMTITQTPQINTTALAAFASITSDCSGLCLNGVQVSSSVQTVSEVELLNFLMADVEDGDGLLIDARTPRERQIGFIASSVNVPAQTLEPENKFSTQILGALGGRAMSGGIDFSEAYDLMIYDSGPNSIEAQRLISLLVDANYPPEKLKYYRGGMQVWAGLGLSFVQPQS